LRCGLLKQYRQLSYEELAFHLQDSASFRAFARLPVSWCPKKSVLHKTMSAVRAETWEQINRALLGSAHAQKLESGQVIRLDSTTSAALLHEPSDNTLLWDAVRVMVRLLERAVRRGAAVVAQSSARGQEAGVGDRSQPQPDPAGQALSRADCGDAGELGLSAAGGDAGRRGDQRGGRDLARRGAALRTPDRTDH
jgi:IS5 family transposase